jgi:citrate lyase beta subunit
MSFPLLIITKTDLKHSSYPVDSLMMAANCDEKRAGFKHDGRSHFWLISDIKVIPEQLYMGLDDKIVLCGVRNMDELDDISSFMKSNAGLDIRGFWLLIDNVENMFSLRSLFESTCTISGLILDTIELGNSMALEETPGRLGLLGCISEAVLTCRFYKVPILDGAHPLDAKDKAFAKVCEQARKLGFDGKVVTSVEQYETAKDIFST